MWPANRPRTLLAEEVVLPREDDEALNVPDDGFALQLLPVTLPGEHAAAVWAAREKGLPLAPATELARQVLDDPDARASSIQVAYAGYIIRAYLREDCAPSVENALSLSAHVRAYGIELPDDPRRVCRWARDCLRGLNDFYCGRRPTRPHKRPRDVFDD